MSGDDKGMKFKRETELGKTMGSILSLRNSSQLTLSRKDW